MIFRDRHDAGALLAERVAERWQGRGTPLVLALPRGGVAVAAPIARRLSAPLDVLIVRKLGTPGHPELAMGALASNGTRVLNRDVIRSLAIDPDDIETVAERERAELERRETIYRADRPPLRLEGREVILVDDGLATGATARVAVQALRRGGVGHLLLAVPVAAPEVADQLAAEVDDSVVLSTPAPFEAVGRWFEDFSEVTDRQVVDTLDGGGSGGSADASSR